VVEGVIVGSYAFERYKAEKNTYLGAAAVTLLASDDALALCRSKFERYALVSNAVNECREIVNEPGCAVYPEVLGNLAKQIGKKHGLKVIVLDEKALEKGGYTGLTGVGKGSVHPPRLISLEYKAPKKSPVRLARGQRHHV
jgi:leucyl aminopeptidase